MAARSQRLIPQLQVIESSTTTITFDGLKRISVVNALNVTEALLLITSKISRDLEISLIRRQ